MSVLSMLSTLLIGPLKLIFEVIFMIADSRLNHPGISIIVLSLVMNFLVLPLYKRADAMQEASRDVEAKLHDGVAHIKKTFSGDERMMILQTYYRQNHYKPTDALHGSVSLLLEIPFFMAAYQFLSGLQSLQGASLGPIADLSQPDGLLVIGGLCINVLPILMTLINVISSAIYLKGFPTKTKVQLYAMALFFLVFLYTSPAGLVFYWTLNNLFSLCKTIFYKLKNPRKVLKILACAAGWGALYLGFARMEGISLLRLLIIAGGLAMQLPVLLPVLMKGRTSPVRWGLLEGKPERKLFVLGAVFLTVLVGLLIPSNFIAASPQEYVDLACFYDPMLYIVSAVCLAAGTFLVWMGVFYWLANDAGKVLLEKLVWIACGVMLVNYMCFGTDLGVLSLTLQYATPPVFTGREKLINLAVLAVLAAGMYMVVSKKRRAAEAVLLAATLAMGGMSAVNMASIRESVDQIVIQNDNGLPTLQLSKDGQNVVVMMLDRAGGEYIPYIFQEKPELKEQFSGFTYYDNTISFGKFTNYGTPALFGGYEYTPVEMNKRSDELLADKHNEALKVMPVIFSENGFDVTFCDPTYANYQWIPDLSVFDEYPEIRTYITKGAFDGEEGARVMINNNSRNFFCFSIVRTMPLVLQPALYNGGQYNQSPSEGSAAWGSQVQSGVSQSEGMSSLFMSPYNVLCALQDMTHVSETTCNTLSILTNDATHEPMLLQTPDYVPAEVVDNTQYDAEHADRFTIDGRTLAMGQPSHMIHYHANMAALIQLGNWFDYLKANGVYDNTRIILVADHGVNESQLDELNLNDGQTNGDGYFPLLMVKDFNSTEFTVSSEFMTNADVPTLAMAGLIENPVNPFTGKAITSEEKTAHDQYILLDGDWHTDVNNGCTFLPSTWAKVHSNLWDRNNWTFFNEETVLDEYAFPSEKQD